jgi:hypothetical protein
MDASRTEPALHDLEAAALAQHHVGSRDADVVEEDLSVAVRRVVVPEDGEHALDCDARGGSWDEDDGLALVDLRVVGRGLAHDHVDLAAEVACPGGPPFLSTQRSVLLAPLGEGGTLEQRFLWEEEGGGFPLPSH